MFQCQIRVNSVLNKVTLPFPSRQSFVKETQIEMLRTQEASACMLINMTNYPRSSRVVSHKGYCILPIVVVVLVLYRPFPLFYDHLYYCPYSFKYYNILFNVVLDLVFILLYVFVYLMFIIHKSGMCLL